jgi:hypothetical protein
MGYRTGHFWIGASGVGGTGPTSTEGDLALCEHDDVECRNGLARLDVVARYYLLSGERIDPFVGLGAGYEWFFSSVSVDGETLASITARGMSLLSIEAGAQFAESERRAWVAYATYSVGEYEHHTAAMLGEGSLSEMIPGGQRALHHWVAINVGAVLMP